jgi:hypothetical protein
MRVPNADSAAVPEAKIRDYLLSQDHPVGQDKARFFKRFGFSLELWQELAAALLLHIADNDYARTVPAAEGQRYIIEAPLPTPDGRTPWVRSVWTIDWGTTTPRLLTAYPLEG